MQYRRRVATLGRRLTRRSAGGAVPTLHCRPLLSDFSFSLSCRVPVVSVGCSPRCLPVHVCVCVPLLAFHPPLASLSFSPFPLFLRWCRSSAHFWAGRCVSFYLSTTSIFFFHRSRTVTSTGRRSCRSAALGLVCMFSPHWRCAQHLSARAHVSLSVQEHMPGAP